MKHLLPASSMTDYHQGYPDAQPVRNPPVLSALGLVLMFIFLVWQAAVWTERYELQQLHNQASHELTLNIANLRGKLDKYEYLPELLATKQELAAYLLNITPLSTLRLNSTLKTYQQITRVSDIYLLNTDGTTVAASNWQSPRSFIGKNFSFRPYYRDAIQGQKGRFYGLGTTSGERGYYYSYPVFAGQSVIGILVVKIVIDDLEIPWQDPDTEFVVSDPDSVIFISSNQHWLLRSLHPLPEKDRVRINSSRRYGDRQIETLPYQTIDELNPDTWLVRIAPDNPDNAARINRYLQTSLPMPDAGWRVHILKNTRKVRTEILKNCLLTAGIYLVVVLLSMYSVQRQRIQRERIRHDRETQKALEVNEARIRAILDNTQAGIMTMDRLGKIDYINPSAERLFGYQLHELHGQNFNELILEQDRNIGVQALEKANSVAVEIRGVRKDYLPVPVEMVVSMMSRGQQTDYMVTLHDITERKQHEEALQAAYDQMESRVVERTQDLTEANTRLTEEINQHRHTTETLQKTQDELIQAAKLAVLGQMSASINHELNQPIAAIRAYAENGVTFLTRDNQEMAQVNLEQIVELTDRMASISAQLKLFARKSGGELTLISPKATIDYALRLFKPQLEKDAIEFNLQLTDQECYVRADAVRLEQVIVNLISNALHAISHRSTRQVQIAMSLHTAEVASPHDTIIRDELWIEVSDSGPGIAEQHIGQIFNPFFSTRDEGKGLGLGLSISYRIISDFGGTIKAFNRPEGGATLRVILPLAAGEQD
ncbi:ATP-binding protein [Oceanospirillum sediminis]|uniref:C4-dicarboxylate transport sensor protein DctB n=1 Tax=Oceanospirillum sediminis TaxID=2760088 RepID=A0A839IWF0_9GAMM|nr:ATP-binding protein [Oceanospirillum sediminis]MBB1488779.1 PAS domain S-box protein [Oceanospirillum sediminis]